MNTYSQKYKIRLGLFVAGGLALFIIAIFIIGKQKNLFSPVYKLTTTFYNVSGLQVGNNVRFSGINIGTVDKITIINDSTVSVDMLIKSDVKQFIKTDCIVALGSEGLIGDRLLIITQGSTDAPLAREGEPLASVEPVEMDAIMASLQITASFAEIIAQQLSQIIFKINNGNGTLSKLIQDTTMAENLSQTMINLEKSSKGLEENLEAAKHNFLLRGYFNKKEKAAEKLQKEEQKQIEEQQEEEQKKIEEQKKEDEKGDNDK